MFSQKALPEEAALKELKEKLPKGLTIGKHLGKGYYGSVYQVKGPKFTKSEVVKITSDPSEAIGCQMVKEHLSDLSGFPKINNVFRLASGWFVIFREDLQSAPGTAVFADMHDLSYDAVTKFFQYADGAGNPRMKPSLNEQNEAANRIREVVGTPGLHRIKRLFLDLATAANRGLRVLDIHAGNVRARADGTLVVSDLGLSSVSVGVEVMAANPRANPRRANPRRNPLEGRIVSEETIPGLPPLTWHELGDSYESLDQRYSDVRQKMHPWDVKKVVANQDINYVIANTKFKKATLIGEGAIGKVYLLRADDGSSAVVKITKDPSEVAATSVLSQQNITSLPKIYGMFQLPSGMYAIFREDVPNEVPPAVLRWYDADEHNHKFALYAEGSGNQAFKREAKRHQSKFWRELTAIDPQFALKYKAFLQNMKEYNALGVRPYDMHFYNVRVRDDGSLVATDLGYSLVEKDTKVPVVNPKKNPAGQRKVILFDLDNTLFEADEGGPQKGQFVFGPESNPEQYHFGFIPRKPMIALAKKLAKSYEVVLFTAAHPWYAQAAVAELGLTSTLSGIYSTRVKKNTKDVALMCGYSKVVLVDDIYPNEEKLKIMGRNETSQVKVSDFCPIAKVRRWDRVYEDKEDYVALEAKIRRVLDGD